MAAGDQELKIRIEVDASGALRAFDQAGRSVEVFADRASRAGDSVKGVESAFDGFRGGIVALDAALNVGYRPWERPMPGVAIGRP